MKKNIVIALNFVLILLNTSIAQLKLEKDIKVAFGKSIESNKDLLVIRSDSSINQNGFKNSSQAFLDSLKNDSAFAQKINEKFVVFEFENGKENKIKHSVFQDLAPMYPPVIYCFTKDSLLFYTEYVYGKPNFLNGLLDSIAVHRLDIDNIKSFQNRIKNNNVDTTELLQFMKLENRLGLTYNNTLDLYARKGGEFNLKLADILDSQDWIPLDGYFCQTVLNKPKKNINENLFLRCTINRSIHSATILKNKKKFDFAIQCLEKEASLNEEIKIGIFSSFTESNLALKGRIIYSKFVFSDSTNDKNGIQKYGTAYVDYLFDTYQKRLDEAINKNGGLMDYVMLYSRYSIENTDSTKKRLKDYLNNEEQRKRQMINDFNNEDAQLLNEICWTFYLKVTDKAALKKALEWSRKTINYANKHYYLDTYAHLLFVLGNKNEAIEQEKNAIEVAQKIKDLRAVQEYTKELNKFKIKN